MYQYYLKDKTQQKIFDALAEKYGVSKYQVADAIGSRFDFAVQQVKTFNFRENIIPTVYLPKFGRFVVTNRTRINLIKTLKIQGNAEKFLTTRTARHNAKRNNIDKTDSTDESNES